MKKYKKDFYQKRHNDTVYSAEQILSIIIALLPEINSAIDVGCGVGTWLSVLKSKGVMEVTGIDGDWVDVNLLQIPEDCFVKSNLENLKFSGQKYDLAISLEVAEHLPEENAAKFIKCLTELSDFVLFSAAIPFQGGKNHINERWPEYWEKIFSDRNFSAYDVIRSQVWADKDILVHYKQNIFLYVNNSRRGDVVLDSSTNLKCLPLVHYELFLQKSRMMESVHGSWKIFAKALKKKLKWNR